MPPLKATPELIRQNEALRNFFEYVRAFDPEVRPEEISIHHEHSGEGTLEMLRIDNANGRFFSAEFDASRSSGALTLNRGHQSGDEDVFDDTQIQNVANACKTLHALGGKEAASFQCPDLASSASIFSKNARWFGKWGLAGWANAEFWSGIARHVSSFVRQKTSPPTAYLWRKLVPQLRLIGANEVPLLQRMKISAPGLVAGAAGMIGSRYLADALGWHPIYHRDERFALGAGLAQLSSQIVPLVIPKSLAPTPVPGMTLMRPSSFGSRLLATAKAEVGSFGSRLLTSAFVDATLGQLLEDHPSGREALRMASFFGTDLYRMAMGPRNFAFTQSPKVQFLGRWASRLAVAGYVGDLAYMAYNHFHLGSAASGRENRLYQRATQFQAPELHPLSWIAHGAAQMIAPNLAQRWVDDQYVDQARLDLEAQSANTVGDASGVLRQVLLAGPLGFETDPRFYRELDLNWLRGENTLKNFRLPDGRRLPVAGLAELLSNPTYRRVIESLDHDQQIGYVQRRFSAYPLSPEDVATTFALVTWQQIRQNLGGLKYAAGGEPQAFAACFDESGALRPGQEQALLDQVFPSQKNSPEKNATERVLALRRDGLERRIRELQASGASRENPYFRVAQEIGLIDAKGQLVPGEETRLAQNSIVPATSKKHEKHGRLLLGSKTRGANSPG